MELTEIMPGIRTHAPSPTSIYVLQDANLKENKYRGKAGLKILEWFKNNKPPYFTAEAAREIYGMSTVNTRKKVGQLAYLLRKQGLTSAKFALPKTYKKSKSAIKQKALVMEGQSKFEDFIHAVETFEKLSSSQREAFKKLIS